MHWVEPTQKDSHNQTPEKNLWAAPDQFRADPDIGAAQYSRPILRDKNSHTHKEGILTLFLTLSLCEVLNGKLKLTATEVNSRKIAFQPIKSGHSLFHFYRSLVPDDQQLPSRVIQRKFSDKIGKGVTIIMRPNLGRAINQANRCMDNLLASWHNHAIGSASQNWIALKRLN